MPEEIRAKRTVLALPNARGRQTMLHEQVILPGRGMVERRIHRDMKGGGHIDLLFQKAPPGGEGQYTYLGGKRFQWDKEAGKFVQTHSFSFEAVPRSEGLQAYTPTLTEVDSRSAEEIPAEEMSILSLPIKDWIEDPGKNIPQLATMDDVTEEDAKKILARFEEMEKA